jgi:hypothetical protein
VLGHLQAGAERAAQRCEPREGTVARLQGPSTLIAISVLYESNVLYRFTRGPLARRLYWNQVLPPPLAVCPRLGTRHEVVLRPGRHCRTVRRVDGVVQRHFVPRLAQHRWRPGFVSARKLVSGCPRTRRPASIKIVTFRYFYVRKIPSVRVKKHVTHVRRGRHGLCANIGVESVRALEHALRYCY